MNLRIHHFKRRTILFGDGGTVNALISTGTGIGTGYASIAFNNFLFKFRSTLSGLHYMIIIRLLM